MSEQHTYEVVNEPPRVRAGSRVKGGCDIHFVKEKTGEVINHIQTPEYVLNECRPREERKY